MYVQKKDWEKIYLIYLDLHGIDADTDKDSGGLKKFDKICKNTLQRSIKTLQKLNKKYNVHR